MTMNLPTRYRRLRRGFTMVEALASATLLGVGVIGMTALAGVSRNFAEKSRGAGEFYAVARQEVERDRQTGFRKLFYDSGNRLQTANPYRTDYGNVSAGSAAGEAEASDRINFCKPLTAANVAKTALPALSCVLGPCSGRSATTYFRTVSTYSLVKTGTETEKTRMLGIQKVQVFQREWNQASERWEFDESDPSTLVYETTAFYTDLGKW